MVRLRSTRQSVNNNQLIGYFIVLILLIIFLGTVGLKFLLNTSIFIANKLSNTRSLTQKEADPEFATAPEFDNIPEATNSASIQVSGTAPIGRNLKIYVNGELEKDILLTEEQFDTTISLQEGQNTIYGESIDTKTNDSKKSPEYSVFFSNKKPTLVVTSPTDGSITDKQEIEIVGTTDSGSSVTVGGRPAVVNGSGSFSFTLILKDGDNTITIRATDQAGNSEEKIITVKKEN